MANVYKEYRNMVPDAQDPTDLVSSLGMDGTDDLVVQAVRERKRIVIEVQEGTLDGLTYRLEPL